MKKFFIRKRKISGAIKNRSFLKGKFSGFLVTFLVTVSFNILAQVNPEFTTQGTEFWVTFGQNTWTLDPDGYFGDNASDIVPYYPYSPVTLGVKIAAKEQTVVTYEFKDNPSLDTSFIIQAGTVGPLDPFSSLRKHAVYLSRPYVNAYSIPAYAAIKNKTLRITTDKPVSVYAINHNSGSGDATNVFPVDNWGTSYYHISTKSDASSATGASKYVYEFAYYDGYAVIASKDGTIIKDNGTQVALLNRGQVYYSYSAQALDFTGRLITSNYPVAYYVINTGTQIPSGKQATENLFQQLMSINLWGRNFIVPLTHRGKERVRIISSQPGTNLTISSSPYTIIAGLGGNSVTSLSNIPAGKFVEIEMSSACFISSNFPVGVCSFMLGSQAINPVEDIKAAGDPSMTWIPPVEQMIYSTTIAPFDMKAEAVQGAKVSHYAMVVVPVGSESEVKVGIGTGPQLPLSGGSWQSSVSGYTYYEMQLDSSLIYSFDNPQGLMLIAYGYGGSKSYYYVAGAGARSLNPHIRVDDDHYQDVQHKVFCNNNIEIRGRISSQSSTVNPYLRWIINGQEQVTLRNDTAWNVSEINLGSGDHKMQMVVTNSVEHIDTCTYYFTINPVTASISGETTICVESTTNLAGTPVGGSWTSLNPTVATVNNSGLVTALSTGTARFVYTVDACTDTTGVLTIEDCCPPGPVVYVNRNINPEDEGDGSSWAEPLIEIADALLLANRCADVKEVWVAEGIYHPLYNASTGIADASRNVAFVVPDGVKMYGGFPPNANDNDNGPIGGIITREQALKTRERDTYQTFMSGDLNKNDISGDKTTRAENVYHVVRVEGTALIDGFIITGGYANGTAFPDNSGAGIWANVNSIDDTLVLNNNIIEKNIASGYIASNIAPKGAGIRVTGNAVITNNEIRNNILFADDNTGSTTFGSTSLDGAGICASTYNSRKIMIEDNHINGNIIWINRTTKDGRAEGAGIYSDVYEGGVMEINYNYLEDNEISISGNGYSYAYGGGICIEGAMGVADEGASVLITYNHINKNKITGPASGGYFKGGGVSTRLASSGGNVSRIQRLSGAITPSPGAVVVNNLIAGNTIEGYSTEGGAIYAEIDHRSGGNSNAKVSVVNNTVVSNVISNGVGGGLYLQKEEDNGANERFKIWNNIVWNNRSTVSDDIYRNSEDDIVFAIARNLIGTTSSTLPAVNENTLGTGSENNPHFADDSNTDVSLNDYQLAIGSPAINSGDDTYYTTAGGNVLSNKDLADNARRIENTIDKGAYESRQYFFSLHGTVFPFVKTEAPSFDSLFVVTAALYALPDTSANTPAKKIRAISKSAPLFVDTLKYYDGTIYIPGTPKNPGDFMQTNNPGLPINWGMLNKPIGNVDTSTVQKDSIPTKPVGYYNFDNVLEGEYILQISRSGYLTRYAKITVSKDVALGHREILGGDVNSTRLIDGADFSLLIANYSNYGEAKYSSKFDLNGNRIIDRNDLNILLFNMAASYRIYVETNDWLME